MRCHSIRLLGDFEVRVIERTYNFEFETDTTLCMTMMVTLVLLLSARPIGHPVLWDDSFRTLGMTRTAIIANDIDDGVLWPPSMRSTGH